MEQSQQRALLTQLTQTTHGDLTQYVRIAAQAAKDDPEFVGRLIGWTVKRGHIRDAKVALPVVSLTAKQDPSLIENALAYMADLPTKQFVKAVEFALSLKQGIPAQPAIEPTKWRKKGRAAIPAIAAHPLIPGRIVKRLVERYLRDLEADQRDFDREAARARKSLRHLYGRFRIKPSAHADSVLFGPTRKQPDKDSFEVGLTARIRQLSTMDPTEAAGFIMAYNIPFLSARGALGAKAKHPDCVMALLKVATADELVTNAKAFQRLGIDALPALRSAFEEALGRAGKSKKTGATLKATAAADAIEAEGGDSKLVQKLRQVQEQRIESAKGIEGDWLVLGDRSSSMEKAVEGARQVAATLAKFVKGNVDLIFFNDTPRQIDATGKTYEWLLKETKLINAHGWTSIGCGLQWAVDNARTVGGIAIVSDGNENKGVDFATAYKAYVSKMGGSPTVYLYLVGAQTPEYAQFKARCEAAKIDVQVFDLTKTQIDYYGIPSLVQTMRTGRYSMLDEIYATPLMELDDVLTRTTSELTGSSYVNVLREAAVTA